MQVGGSRASGELPQAIIDIIKGGWEETGQLRQSLIGQMMGILTGEGPYEYVNVGTPGYWATETRRSEQHMGEGEGTVYGPPVTTRRWIPGKKSYEWQKTGGPNAQIPIIQQAQERQRQATSSALKQTEASLARFGQTGTPFGEQILAGQRQQGASSIAGIETEIMKALYALIPGFVQGQSSSVMGATAGARETDAKSGQFGFG